MDVTFPVMTDIERLTKLTIPTDRPVDMVLDTDTYNEVDDQFAILYAMCSPDRINLLAIYAALFHNKRSASPEDGMEKSYQEILKVLKLMGRESKGFAFRGCPKPIGKNREPVQSDAVTDLIERAMKRGDDDPLFVVGIGACTNIASAMLIQPEIVKKIVVVWMIGNSTWWHDNYEFNLSQDPDAAAVLFDSGVPLLQVPAFGVTNFLSTTIHELNACIRGANPVCDFLSDNVKAYSDDHFAWSKAIWDIGAIAPFINTDWTPMKTIPAPIFLGDHFIASNPHRHLINTIHYVDRDAIFKDMFEKLRNCNL